MLQSDQELGSTTHGVAQLAHLSVQMSLVVVRTRDGACAGRNMLRAKRTKSGFLLALTTRTFRTAVIGRSS